MFRPFFKLQIATKKTPATLMGILRGQVGSEIDAGMCVLRIPLGNPQS